MIMFLLIVQIQNSDSDKCLIIDLILCVMAALIGSGTLCCPDDAEREGQTIAGSVLKMHL